MGVRGLMIYVDDIPSVWTTVDLKDTKVIIDGKALLYYLQRDIDSRYGGQYDTIGNAIEHFFTCFDKNKVTTYVIFDGPTVAVEKKLSTLKERALGKIKRCFDVSKQGTSDETVDPPLAMMLLLQKIKNLKHLGIHFAVCDREADQELASLANQWNCPVISNDSDFFIYDLPAGYIPLTHLNVNMLHRTRIYHREKLSQHLNVQPHLLPLLASLLGNDYVRIDVLNPFQRALQSNQPAASGQSTDSKIAVRMRKICSFLDNSHTPDDSLQSVLAIIPKDNERASLEKSLRESMNEYKILDEASTVAPYFESGDIQSRLANVPAYVIKRYRHGNFPVRYFGVISCGRINLKSQVEDMSKISSNKCSLQLRQVIYGILPTQSIIEWDRVGLCLKQYSVQPFVGPVKGYGDLPNLESLHEQDGNQRTKLLLSILESNTAIQSLPDTDQLFAASIRYWILHATPKVTQRCVKTLILQYLQQRTSTKQETTKPNVDIALRHSLAQWQSVMAETLHLNKILLDAFPEPDLSKLFNGVIAHTIKYELDKGKPLEDFNNPLDDYKQIYDAATQGLHDRDKAKRKPKKKASKKQVSSATNRFAALEQLSGDGNDDDGDDDDGGSSGGDDGTW